MAVRFDGTSTTYYTSATVPTAPFTAAMWATVDVDRNTFSTFLSINGGSNRLWLQTNADGVTPVLFDGAASTIKATGTAMTVGAWYFLAAVVNGASTTLYQAALGAASLTANVVSSWTNPSANTSIEFGIGSSTQEPLNGRLAAIRLWAAALTAAELENEFRQYRPVRAANLSRFHPLLAAETVDYSGNGNTLTAGSSPPTTEDGPPLRWNARRIARSSVIPRQPSVEVGQAVFGTANFEVAIQAVETGLGITSRAWTVVSGPAEVATTIGTSSLLSWFPATAGVYELEYTITNSAGSAYDTVYVTVNATGTVVNTQAISGTGATLVCTKPTGLAELDVMLAVQSGDAAEHDEMRPPAGWQPLFEYDVGSASLHLKGWTLTAGPSEPSTYTFAQGTGSAGVVSITALRGVVEAGVAADVSYAATTSATRTAPTIEKAVPGSVLLCGAMADPGATRTWTPPTGMTEQADLQSTTNTTHTVASKLDPGAPTGTKDFTASGLLAAVGGIQWSAVFPMPPDPQRGVDNKSMIAFVRTT